MNIYDKEIEDGKGLHRFICIECPGVSEDEIDIISDDVSNGVKAEFVLQRVLVLRVVTSCEECVKTTGDMTLLFCTYSNKSIFMPLPRCLHMPWRREHELHNPFVGSISNVVGRLWFSRIFMFSAVLLGYLTPSFLIFFT